MRSSVDLPDPLAPINPTRSPSLNPSVIPENNKRGPNDLARFLPVNNIDEA
jgi:hypothetical protein